MKVLILTCSYGEGHNSVAAAIKEQLEKNKIEFETIDTAIFASKRFAEFGVNVFNKTAVNSPKLLNIIYKMGLFFSNDKVKSPVYIKNTMYAKKIKEYILNNNFDTVFCTHLFSMQTISYLINKGLEIKTYGIITDYCYIPFIEETNLDYYFIPHKNLIKDFVKKGLPKKKLIPLGIPVKSVFADKISQEEAMKKLNIKTTRKIILIMMGGLGCGDALGLCQEILKTNQYHVIVLTGKNKQLIKELKKKLSNHNLEIVPFTNQVNSYLSVADVVVSKPGGISSTEILIKKKPLIHFEAFLGVEEYNRKFFEKNKASIYSKKIKDINEKINLVLTNKFKFNYKLANPNSAQDIVDFLIKNT